MVRARLGPDKPHGTASMAKALVGGMSLLVAMSDGLIAPDDPACKYIAEWRSDPIKSKITIRQLATHTSGIEDAEQDSIPHDKLPGWKGAFWRRSPLPLRQVCTVATSTLLKTRLFDPFGIPEGLVDRIWARLRSGRSQSVCELGRREFHRSRSRSHRPAHDARWNLERPRAGPSRGREASDGVCGHA